MMPPSRPPIPAGFHGDHNAYKRHLQNQNYWARRNLMTQEENKNEKNETKRNETKTGRKNDVCALYALSLNDFEFSFLV